VTVPSREGVHRGEAAVSEFLYRRYVLENAVSHRDEPWPGPQYRAESLRDREEQEGRLRQLANVCIDMFLASKLAVQELPRGMVN
jgi:hypothetical protein